MRQVQKRGPLVNSEFYTGWIAFWNEPRPARHTEDIIRVLKRFLVQNVSFNFFMFHGGTNFGFTTGATTTGTVLEKSGYKPQMTSYDFTSPLDEAGDPTEKYHAIKQALKEAVIFKSNQYVILHNHKILFRNFQIFILKDYDF